MRFFVVTNIINLQIIEEQKVVKFQKNNFVSCRIAYLFFNSQAIAPCFCK